MVACHNEHGMHGEGRVSSLFERRETMANATPNGERCQYTNDWLWECNCATQCAKGRQEQPWRYRQPSQSTGQRTVQPPTSK